MKIKSIQWRQPTVPRLRKEAPSEPGLHRVGGWPPKGSQLQLPSLRGDANPDRAAWPFPVPEVLMIRE